MNSIILNEIDELKYGRREAINSLRTNIKFAGNDIKVVAVTSCNPNEGKSTTCFDLAKSFADAGNKVLMIDADMRKTVMLQRYRIDNRGQQIKGLSHYLSGQVPVEGIINTTNIRNLFMVLAGPAAPNPAELLSGSLIDDMISTCRKIFDMIIIDTPPLGAVIDAAIIAPKCDGVVMLCEANSTSAKVAIGVKKQLEMTGCKILGCVLNKVPSSASAYKYKYRYYGEEETGGNKKKEKSSVKSKIAGRIT